ncbi:unnamed protein product [Rodentolepis nana]|uniref:C2 domain-containing protein n=1 Tax=Rodentolepis nana TaxID=102285 RepID=A0A0R3T6L0_RODNA|nr:unnamed protein product [Rodentolepis nana]
MSESSNSLFDDTRLALRSLDRSTSIYNLYCRVTLGLRNADSWDCVNVHGTTTPIFNTELTMELALCKCASVHFRRT